MWPGCPRLSDVAFQKNPFISAHHARLAKCKRIQPPDAGHLSDLIPVQGPAENQWHHFQCVTNHADHSQVRDRNAAKIAPDAGDGHQIPQSRFRQRLSPQ
jgi:hypothetical protein